MPAATYQRIQTVSLVSGTSPVSFTSINQTFTDLILVLDAQGSSGNNYVYCRLNDDYSSNYRQTFGVGRLNNQSTAQIGNNDTGFALSWSSPINVNKSNSIVHFMNYTNTNFFKNILLRTNQGLDNSEVTMAAGTWRSTSAITSITLDFSSNVALSNTMITLYGIKAE